MSDDVYRSQPDRLASLMNAALEPTVRWSDDDLSAILLHQLQAPLFFDLSRLTTDQVSAPLANFGDLLRHPQPPLQLLKLTKQFAKQSDGRAEDPLPPEIATVMYYAAIIAARMRLGERISELSDAALLDGVDWVLRQRWVDPGTIELFQEARGGVIAAGRAKI